MDKFLMFWALLNFVISAVNLVNMRALRVREREFDATVRIKEMQQFFDETFEDEEEEMSE